MLSRSPVFRTLGHVFSSPRESYIPSDMIRYYLFRQDHFLACINVGNLSWFFNFHYEPLLIVLLTFTNIYTLLQSVILKEQLLGLGIWSFPRLLNFTNEQMDNNNINLYWEIRTNSGKKNSWILNAICIIQQLSSKPGIFRNLFWCILKIMFT